MISYEIYWMTDDGTPLGVFTERDITSLELAYGDQAIGALELSMPRKGRSPTVFEKDQILEVYRIVDGVKTLEGQRSWRIRKRQFGEDENGRETIYLTAYDWIYTLDNSIIAYYADSAFAKKTDYADDMIKAIVYENMGAGCKLYTDGSTADTARILSNLTIQADASLAPSISKKFAWEKIKPNLDEICNDSRQQGTWLGYDIVRTGRALFELRTYTGQRGIDFTTGSNRKVISKEFRNLINPMLSFDDENERNYAYVAGAGLEAERTITVVSDTERINQSIWNRREMVVNAAYLGDDTTIDYLTSQGNAALYEDRPKISLVGEIVENTNFRYGIDFGYGDKFKAEYLGYTFDVRLDKVHILVNPGRDRFETLNIRISGEL